MSMQNGQPKIGPAKGYTFFEARPEFFLPTHGGYDIRYKTTSSLPISKPLQMQKADELYDRLIQNPAFDPGKLGDYLVKSREENPDDFRKGAPQGQPGGINLQQAIDLAGVENSKMLAGQQIASTPYAPVPHTEVHIEFMNSEQFKKQASMQVVQIFTNHVIGEVAAQMQRDQGGQQQPSQPGQPDMMGGRPGQPPQPTGGEADMQNVMPGMMQGGGDTQNVSGAQQQ